MRWFRSVCWVPVPPDKKNNYSERVLVSLHPHPQQSGRRRCILAERFGMIEASRRQEKASPSTVMTSTNEAGTIAQMGSGADRAVCRTRPPGLGVDGPGVPGAFGGRAAGRGQDDQGRAG